MTDTFAPDGSEIRYLAGGEELATRSSLVEVRLSAGQVTGAISHRTVEETWHIVAGSGEVWRSLSEVGSQVDRVAPGDTLVIPTGCAFQFSAGPDGLRFLCFTSPPWPGVGDVVALAEGALGPPRLGARTRDS